MNGCCFLTFLDTMGEVVEPATEAEYADFANVRNRELDPARRGQLHLQRIFGMLERRGLNLVGNETMMRNVFDRYRAVVGSAFGHGSPRYHALLAYTFEAVGRIQELDNAAIDEVARKNGIVSVLNNLMEQWVPVLDFTKKRDVFERARRLGGNPALAVLLRRELTWRRL